MMQQAAIVERADDQQQRGSRKDCENLAQRFARFGYHKPQKHGGVDGNSAQQRNGLEVDFSRTRSIHHTYVNGELPHRQGDH